ncbi:interleukin-22 receptor subunit alpha-1 [Onychostruthus taczanowskii]|uniref:interleukin-22 receptor subunit alpha-1 n=1 Tax=Onychostruthus taczanowskii TaxID=356909 RepID=UPI001B808194|nr:interleukin-22 receptor subunit alpha-1 [Onychostruthus taczanowskii]
MKGFLIVLAGVSVLGIVTTERSSCLKRAAFSSTNFENILTWETEADIPPGTVFDVQYKQYGEKSWLTKHECQSITQLFCNLSKETENFREHFYGRVRARGCSPSWVRSERFEPRKETIIGAPQVEHIPYVRSIKFLIRPPLTPLRGEDEQQLSVEDIYSKFGTVDYHLTIFNQRTQQQWTKNEHNKEFEVSNLDPDTEYNGTVYICLLQRRSKPQVFWVKTLADKTWILYCLVALAFCAGLVFAATAFVIYKYIKQRSAQPRALDFRGIPSFQPLTLTVEHIIKPLSFSKPSPFIPEVQLAQMSQHLDWALEPRQPSCPYQQQVDVAALQLTPEPSQVEMPAPITAYTPQRAEQSTAAAPGSSSLALTYGLCVEGTDRSSQPEQRLKESSPDRSEDGELRSHGLGKSCSHWDYKEQQPKAALWKSRDRLESVVIQGSPGQSQLLLQSEGLEDPERVSQLSLSLLEQGGCYRQQAALSLLLPAGKAAPASAAEEELLAPLLLSVRTGSDPPAGRHGEQWVLPEPFPHPADRVQLPETAAMEMFPAAKGLGCTELSGSPGQDRGTPLTMLFKDLDLKVQWDEESTEFY